MQVHVQCLTTGFSYASKNLIIRFLFKVSILNDNDNNDNRSAALGKRQGTRERMPFICDGQKTPRIHEIIDDQVLENVVVRYFLAIIG